MGHWVDERKSFRIAKASGERKEVWYGGCVIAVPVSNDRFTESKTMSSTLAIQTAHLSWSRRERPEVLVSIAAARLS